MKIDPKRLLAARGAMTKEALADKARISAKQIARLEAAKGPVTCRAHTLECLAKALDVAPEALMPVLPDRQRKTPGWPKPVRLMLSDDTVLKAQLAAQRYGMETRDIFEMAPLLLTLLAEASLADRRARLDAFKAQFKAAMALAPGHLPQAQVSWADHERAADQEQASIVQRDIFGYAIESDDDHDDVESPFFAYLNALIPAGSDAFDGEIGGLTGKVDCRKILEADLTALVGDDHRARYSLEAGYARLRDIPAELEGPDRLADRQAWLAAKIPDDVWQDWQDSIANFDLGDL